MGQWITDSLVKRLEPPAKGNRKTMDGRDRAPRSGRPVTGFGVRVTAAGDKAFVFRYRNAEGLERMATIGTYGDPWSVEGARARAKELREAVDRGQDPLQERRDRRSAPTVRRLAERYTEEWLPGKRQSSQADDRSMLKNIILPTLGRRKVASVEYSDIQRLHRTVTERSGPYRANRLHALLSKMFALASTEWRREFKITENPCKGIRRNPEVKRKRYLEPDELRRLAEALAAHKPKKRQDSVSAIRLLLLTGARRGEVLGATWDQFDLMKGTWTKPGATTKQKTEHEVPLSPPALQILTEMKAKATGEYLFPGRPGQPQANIRKTWQSICEAAGIEGVRLHDLRHAFASLLVSGGASLPMIGALLGHTQPQTTQRYAHLLDDPLRQLTATVGATIAAAAEAPNGKTADVVTLPKRT